MAAPAPARVASNFAATSTNLPLPLSPTLHLEIRNASYWVFFSFFTFRLLLQL